MSSCSQFSNCQSLYIRKSNLFLLDSLCPLRPSSVDGIHWIVSAVFNSIECFGVVHWNPCSFALVCWKEISLKRLLGRATFCKSLGKFSKRTSSESEVLRNSNLKVLRRSKDQCRNDECTVRTVIEWKFLKENAFLLKMPNKAGKIKSCR